MLGNFGVAAACAIGALAALAGSGCSKASNIHDTPEANGQACVACHRAAYATATNPKHSGVMPETCNVCHTTKAWTPATVTPDAHTWFALKKKHAAPQCADCHKKGYLPGDTPNTCVGCHQADYDGTTDPAHKASGFPTDCAGCHSDEGWRPAVANGITSHPWWPLKGKHVAAQCSGCHVGTPPVYKGTPTDCVACHKKDYDGTTAPPHAGLPTTCNTCHAETGWQPSTFAHPWALEGTHAKTPCTGCHTGTPPRFAGTPTTCAGCHQADFQKASANIPGHSGFAQTCENCHKPTAWTDASGGTHPEASFAITSGVHSLGVACGDCHIASLGSPAKGANTDCIHCHLGAHPRSAMDANPKHVGLAGYPGATAPPNFCLTCHPAGKL
jgi:hypothetical protein